MKYFAVIGNPIAHSKSPSIHAAFAEQFGIALQYQRQLVDVGQFDAFARQFFQHADGANVTVPFKEDALQFADMLSDEARLAGAVNTLSKQGNVVKGDNTDGIGLVRDIRDNYGVSLCDKKVLIIGAGGAVRGVILPIAKENPRSITLVNRTHVKAEQLAEQFSDYADIVAQPFTALKKPFDVIINGTSASLSGQDLPLPAHVFKQTTFAYDMVYGDKPTSFLRFATKHGATTADGLGMLVEQAAKSFEIWHGVKPETQSVIQQLRP